MIRSAKPTPRSARLGARLLSRLLIAGLAAAGSFALSSPVALAARGHVFGGSFGVRCTAAPCGNGELKGPNALAVNEASGDVYVVDTGNDRVQYFSSAGTYLGQFNGSGSLPGEGRAAGSGGLPSEVETGRFDEPEGIAVDNACHSREVETGHPMTAAECKTFDPSNGDVYLIDGSTFENTHKVIDKYTAAGEYVGQITAASVGAPEGFFVELIGVAVDPRGAVSVVETHRVGGSIAEPYIDNFTNDSANALIGSPHIYYGNGARSLEPGLAVDSSDDLYLRYGQAQNEEVVIERDSSPEPEHVFENENEVPIGGLEAVSGLAVEASTQDLYVDDTAAWFRFGPEDRQLETFPVPGADGAGIAADNASGRDYVVDPAAGEVDFWEYEPPNAPRVEAASLSEVTATSAAFQAEVNPRSEPGEAPTSYRFQYLTEAEYEANLEASREPFAGASQTAEGQLAPSFEIDAVSVHPQGLRPRIAYRFRVLAENSHDPGAPVAGEAIAFTTQGTAPFALLDGRAWEMVSPIEKEGGSILGLHQHPYGPIYQAAADGESVAYGSTVAFAGSVSSPPGDQYLATRSPLAWSTQPLNIPAEFEDFTALGDPPYEDFSTDLSRALVANANVPGVTPPAPLPGTEAVPGVGNYYLRDDATGAYEAILNAANSSEASLPLLFDGADPSLRHIIFSDGRQNLYEWSQGRFAPLNLLPGKTRPTPGPVGVGDGPAEDLGTWYVSDPRAVSADGSRVVWAYGHPSESGHSLYLRENVGQPQSALASGQCTEPEMACTVQIDASRGGLGVGGEGQFVAASADDSKIFFTDGQRLTADSTASGCSRSEPCGDLYLFEPEAAGGGPKLTDLTVDEPEAAQGGAEVAGLLGSSEDGSYVYFAADGVLTTAPNARGETAARGECDSPTKKESARCNLYLLHEGQITFIGSLSAADDGGSANFKGNAGPSDWKLLMSTRTVRVSSDGRSLLFMSRRSLTGYDNAAANGTNCGETELHTAEPLRCSELFLYSAPSTAAPAGRLACLSCNPTGERPLGPSGIPGGTWYLHEQGSYVSRVLTAEGTRVFFDSYDSLVPTDTNGSLDVYEWEAPGQGSCQESSEAFVPAAGGCLGLISSGTASGASEFIDASEGGRDVFFTTGASLVPEDPGSYDLYDARECTAASPCIPPSPPPVAACEGDACQTPPPAPNDLTPASRTLEAPGNLMPALETSSGKPKALTQAQKLAKALKACRKDGGKAKRKGCEKRAREKYAAGKKPKPRDKHTTKKRGR
jgi:hypothetical protein